MRINHNIAALNGYNALTSNSKDIEEAIESLTTGMRINSAADDASGMEISENMRVQISGLDQALQNTQDGLSLLQTAEGALDNITSMLQRMRELSVQASSGTLTQQDRKYIQTDVDKLKEEINRTAQTTQFNKKKLLNGDAAFEWSSSDSGVRANIGGTMGTFESLEDLKDAEGNYDIEIMADPGQAQVMKSNIFNVTVIHERHRNEYTKADGISRPGKEPSIEDNSIGIDFEKLQNGDSGTGWRFDNNSL